MADKKLFRKKPVVIEAIQWDGTLAGIDDIISVFPDIRTVAKTAHPSTNKCSFWKIGTLEGSHEVSAGDFIIRGVKGEYYPCKPDIFFMTYEPATATPPADAALADEVTENLVALVGRLSHQLSKATPGHRLPVKAMAYLEQIGFKFHVARHGGPEAATQGKEPETIWRWYALDHTGYCYGANPPSNLPERCCLTAFHRHMDATEAAAALRARAVPEVPLSALVCVGRARFPRTGGNAGIAWHVEDALSDTGGFRSGSPCNGELLFVLPTTAKRAMLAANQPQATAVPEGFSLVENSALSTARMALAHATTEHGELYRDAYESLLPASSRQESE